MTVPGRITAPKILLLGAVLAGPVFNAVVIAEMLTRAGFNLARHPLSLLSLGEAGWIQVANFIVTGLLVLVGAVGFRRALAAGVGRTWGPILIGLFGAGTVVGGLFPPDAAFGFPPGSPNGVPAQLSGHAILHGVGFDVAFISLIAASLVFARRYRAHSRRGWCAYSLATGVTIPVLIVGGMSVAHFMGIGFFIAALIAFTWLTAVACLEAKQ